jgi:hypothetical protein
MEKFRVDFISFHSFARIRRTRAEAATLHTSESFAYINYTVLLPNAAFGATLLASIALASAPNIYGFAVDHPVQRRQS